MIAARTAQFLRSRRSRRRPAAFVAAVVVYIIVILVSAPEAQQPGFAAVAANGANGPTENPAPIRDATNGSAIDLLVGRSTVLNVGSVIGRVSLTVPDIADALVTSPTQLLIHGKKAGTISLFVWDKGGAIKTFEVSVRRDLNALKEQLKQLFPTENITVLGNGNDVVISGTVESKYVMEKAADVAAGYVEKKENVVNLLKQQEGVASNQVMLRVRFAEVSRSAMQELGASAFVNKSNWAGRTAPPGVPSPDFDAEKGLVFSDFLNLFLFNSQSGLGGVVKALSNKGLFQSLAEPNLIATNGKEASFLAGGEYPYPVVQSGTSSNSVTIMFKEFGVRLSFTPTVLGGDLIHLKVKPEVSSLDFANAVVIDGFRIPALSTRRTETEVELRDGQTFAIAGLMNNTLTSTMGKIPGIGDIPILGALFRSKAHQKNQTELVVMITPSIVKRDQMGVSEGLPTPVEPYLGRPNKTVPNPDAYVGSPRYPANQPAKGGSAAATPAATPSVEPRSLPSTVTTQPKAAASKPVASKPVPAATPAPAPAQVLVQTPARSMAQPQASQPAVTQSQVSQPQASAPAPVLLSSPAAAPAATTTTTAPSAAASALAASAWTPTTTPAQTTPLTPQQTQAIEKARANERKSSAASTPKAEKAPKVDKKKAREAKIAELKAEEDRKNAAKLAKERAKRDAELEKRKSEEDQKREKGLTDAALRLKEAQDAYQSELAKTKGSDDKKSSTVAAKSPAMTASRQ
jgi:pilus assembly protein CpaC